MTKQFYQTLLCSLFSFLVINSFTLKAQCPTVSCPSTLVLSTCTTLGQTVTATSNYSSNITSRWIGPNNAWLSTLSEIPIASIGTSTSTALLNHPGTYTVEFKDNSSSCVVTKTISVTSTSYVPVFNLTSSSYVHCVGSTNLFSIANAMSSNSALPFPSTAFSYTFLFPGITTTVLPSGLLSNAGTYSSNLCGPHIFVVKDNTSFCISSFDVAVTCNTNTPIPIIINGTNSVCLGSSVNFTASGANSYIWNTGAVTSTCSILSNSNSFVTVNGTDANGCNTSGSFSYTVNNSCADVWPGDANSDGVVNSTDVLELGLWSSATGPARSFTSNAYSSQYATAWTGTVSTGKNRCHADCNGDGIINAGDNAAISANFNQTHSFKSSSSFSVGDIHLLTSQNILNAGNWNKIDVMLGDVATPMNQIYGLAFEIDYDQSLIMPDAFYLVYSPSFLNASSQNIDFSKNYFNNGKLYAASVRVDGVNVSGNGKIAELYIKPKLNLPANSVLNISVSNGIKINKAAQLSGLNGGSSINVLIDNNALGVGENSLQNSLKVFPNPVTNQLTILCKSASVNQYRLVDIFGRQIQQGDFINSTTLDLSTVLNGVYFICISSETIDSKHKIVVSH